MYFKILLMKKDATEIGRYLLACVYRLDEKYNQSFTEDVIIGVIKGKKRGFVLIFLFWVGRRHYRILSTKGFYELKNLNFICIDDDKNNLSGNDHYKLTPSGLAWLIDKRRSDYLQSPLTKKIKRTPRSKIEEEPINAEEIISKPNSWGFVTKLSRD